MELDNLDQIHFELMQALYLANQNQPGAPVNMYELGLGAGLDKDSTREAFEELIGCGLVEIVSLSGSVVITEAGKMEVEQASGPPKAAAAEAAPALAEIELDPALSTRLAEAGLGRLRLYSISDAAVAEVKALAAGLYQLQATLGGPAGRELAADLLSLQNQLESPRPRAGLTKEALLSILSSLKDLPAGPETDSFTDRIIELLKRLQPLEG